MIYRSYQPKKKRLEERKVLQFEKNTQNLNFFVTIDGKRATMATMDTRSTRGFQMR